MTIHISIWLKNKYKVFVHFAKNPAEWQHIKVFCQHCLRPKNDLQYKFKNYTVYGKFQNKEQYTIQAEIYIVDSNNWTLCDALACYKLCTATVDISGLALVVPWQENASRLVGRGPRCYLQQYQG